MLKFRKVRRGSGLKDFETQRSLVISSLDRKPVQMPKEWVDMSESGTMEDNSSSMVLNFSELFS